MDRKYLFATLALLPLLLLPNRAACAAKQDLFSLSLEQLSNIPVTGSTLSANNLWDVPASVTVFTAEDIRKLPVHTLEDLINYVPGMQSYRTSDSAVVNSSSIRGRRAAASNREILVLLNGMKIDNFFTGGSSVTYPDLPLDNVRRIEFIRGPGSAVYGSNAFTGIINIITDDQHSALNFTAGSNRHVQSTLQQSWDTENSHGHLLIAATHDDGQRYTVPDTFGSSPITTHDPYFTGSAQLQLSLWQDTRVQWVYAAGHSARFYTLGTIDDSFNRYDTEYSGLQLQQTLHWHPDIDSQLLLGTQYSYLQIDNRPVTAVAVGAISNPPATAPLLLRTDIDSTEYSLNWKNDWRLDSAASLQFGLEYRRPRIAKGIADNNYDLAQLSAHDLPVNYYGDLSHQSQVVKKARLDVVGVYLQYQYHINHQWDGIAGGRYDHYSHIGSHFSPRLGLVTHINDRDSLKLLYGEAFRAPQATELYTINNPVLLGNPDLKPETVSTWELIWQHQWQRSQLALNYFSSLFKNAISQQPVNNVRQFANSHQREHSDGIEGEWKTQLSQFWQLHLTATRLLHTPDTFYREASNLFSATGTYERGRWYGTLATYYRSHRATQIDNTGNRRRLADYWQWQGKVGYRWRERLETYLEVLNALDKDYWTPSLTSHIQRGIPNRGRTLLLGMNWDF